MTQKEKPIEDRNANSDRIRRNVKLADEIEDKVEALGMRRPPSGIGAHFSDIAIALEEFNELLNEFLSTDIKDRKTLGSVLTGIEVEVVEHISYHIKYLKRPLGRIIEFCYEDTDNDGA